MVEVVGLVGSLTFFVRQRARFFGIESSGPHSVYVVPGLSERSLAQIYSRKVGRSEARFSEIDTFKNCSCEIGVFVGLIRFRGPIRFKRSGSMKGVEDVGQKRQALLARVQGGSR